MQLVHHQLILPLGEAADGKAVVPIEADGDVQVLHLRQEIETYEVATFCAIVGPHPNVEVWILLLDPGGVSEVENGSLGVQDYCQLLLADGGEVFGPVDCICEELLADVRVEAFNVTLNEKSLAKTFIFDDYIIQCYLVSLSVDIYLHLRKDRQQDCLKVLV